MPIIQGRPSAVVLDAQMHVAFTAASGVVTDYYYDRDAGWMAQDVTGRVVGSPLAKGAVTTIATEGQWHALYRTVGSGLSHLYYRNGDGWFYDDLSRLAGARAMEGPAACAVTPGQLHAFYRDERGHISHVYYREGEWYWEDMAVLVPGSIPDAAGDPTAIYVYKQLHVAWRSEEGRLGHCYHDNATGWVRQEMITPANRAPDAKGAPVFLAYENRLECFYRDINDHIGRLTFAQGAWQYEDLTLASESPVLVAGDPAAIGFNHRAVIVFRDHRGQIAELSGAGNKWMYRDLSQWSAAPRAVEDPVLATFADQLHVVFPAASGHLHDIYFDGNWHDQDLDLIARYPAAIGEMSLHNAGLYTVLMRFNYLEPGGRQRLSPATTSLPFDYGMTRTRDPGRYDVPDGAELWIDVKATFGDTVEGRQHFIYRKDDPHVARYHCAGTTLDVKLVFDGLDDIATSATNAGTPAAKRRPGDHIA
ncbi:hypothetical protein [Tahibacter amnicola]|uniref:YD repeat-containing protein n=1 Tax=Tahibacter amnicola TaxID=2976241 RepID=A0ABY6BDU7_9GAMM|nr:hypothetical protein [Tahibacter amnicola]UXI67982.1 hypothetical protein N4264_25185 [Tahibacter amnicola]